MESIPTVVFLLGFAVYLLVDVVALAYDSFVQDAITMFPKLKTCLDAVMASACVITPSG